MQRLSTSLLRILWVTAALGALPPLPPATAQSAPGLRLQLSAGQATLSINGNAGGLHVLQYADELSPSAPWRLARILRLPIEAYSWTDTTAPAAGQRFYRAVSLENLAWIPPGTFTIGSPETDVDRLFNETQHEVTISRGFWMGRFEVTQGEYLELMGNNPSRFRNGTNASPGGIGGLVTNELSHPVEQLLWSDATNYCARLTRREVEAGRLPASWTYRLPTEAEWEYACRAGSRTAFHYASALRSGMANFRGALEYESSTGPVANPAGIYLGRTQAVGRYEPNVWGLYDMHGNVWEWCQDWYGLYPEWAVIDPMGPRAGDFRVIRGGSWNDDGWTCRAALRYGDLPTRRHSFLGFRVVLAPGGP